MTCLRHGRKAGGYWAAQNGRSRRSQSCGDRSISALGVARSPSEEISALSTGLPKHQLSLLKGVITRNALGLNSRTVVLILVHVKLYIDNVSNVKQYLYDTSI
ncbi:hypothetical protein NDU88_001209 [Pleurodeles waltl]|uniref:Uncharacterized protein n=1 Tax=Pleurodeles waltl TaxID=8319 RepID=A0AAV7TH75_PLEWA|nr:hypothetical protein NDU88_001209 [Pleurodeles waltl]